MADHKDHKQMLHQLLADIAQEQKYKKATITIQPTSSGGANFTSVLYNITISAPDNKQLQLFAKVANIGEQIRKDFPVGVFDIERFVYRNLAEIFRKIEQKCEVPEEHRYVLPKFYGYNPNIYEETIVMEDLTAQGYKMYDRLKSMDWPYASKAAETLAKFHALSMAYEEENPEKYGKLLKRLADQLEPIYKTMSDNFKRFVNIALLATREENKERLRKYFDREIALEENIFSRYYKPKRKAVIIHTDFRQSNIMHRVNEDGCIDLVLLDYQTIQAGCGVSDLLYFIFGGSDAEFRAQYYQKLVDHYYENLAQALRRLRLDPNKIYPRTDFDFELQEALAKVKTSSLYPDRINGVIDDYVRWGIL